MTERAVIVAPATPSGVSALSVVRASGPGLLHLLVQVVRPRSSWAPGRARRVTLHDSAGQFDDGLALYFEGQASPTGEDLLEITLHGHPLLVQRLLRACEASGARLAQPGEFTRRAVAHGKLDLLQAEGLDQLLRAESEAGLMVARAAMDGELGARIHGLRGELLVVAAELEARLDYPADELAVEEDGALIARLARVGQQASALAATATWGRRLVEGATVALIGEPNAGKSSLFNALLGRDRALVHASPGTTRDVVEARLALDGMAITLLDTAGERESEDPIEQGGLALGRALSAEADLVVLVCRARPEGLSEGERALMARAPGCVVLNGVDLPHGPGPEGALHVSAKTGVGLPELRVALRRLLGGAPLLGAERVVLASARQRDLLAEVGRLAGEAAAALGPAGPAVAAELLVQALEELDALTGADTREDVLDALFARFCIGK